MKPAHEIDELLTAISTMTQHVDRAVAFHQARVNIINDIRREAADLPIADLDLAATWERRATNLAAERQLIAEDAARELKIHLNEELDQLTTQLDASDELVADLKSQLAQVEIGERPKSPAQASAVQVQASREDYRREFDDIRDKLKPFITPGYVQPESADILVYEKTKRPFSYSALQRVGALEDNEQGWVILFRVGGSKSTPQQNDRPLGNFPRMNSLSELQKPDVVSRLKEAQRLLRTYGLLMVEDGLLSP